jgi:integrase
MNAQEFSHRFARIGELTKMPFTIHPHMLRHTCGYAWRGSFSLECLDFDSRGAIANTGRASAPSYCNLSS